MIPTKVLIAEDEILIAREIEDILRDLGYEVVAIVQDGEAALQKILETPPDVVLMDIVMPGTKDGIETANQIHKEFHIPVVYLTAHADTDTLERAKISEPFGYILKPFQASELNTTIQIALNRHRIEQLKLSNLRSNINAYLPHEINTPLCIILGSLNLLMNHYDTLSGTEVSEMLKSTYTAATQLDKMCQNFLLHAEMETLSADPQQLQELRKDITYATASYIQGWIEEKAHEFNRYADIQLEIQESSASICKVYLRRIVQELLENALKNSEFGTPIWVISEPIGPYFCLTIRDRGKGLSLDQIANLGEYIQFNREIYERKGLGLGLALIKRLVELHHGTLTIHSGTGTGTTIVVKLDLHAIED
ncbi:MAG: response regulator [Scytolyngbya sp. HA4215-MV1]|jgi:signal transduction histidine kinase|nr:response regulator [Scytolyngbya sp. HA4215-MV1]